MSDGLKVCFRALPPDEGIVSFARRMFRAAVGPKRKGITGLVWLSRCADGVEVQVTVALGCKSSGVSATGTASACDVYRAMVAAFAAAEAGVRPALREPVAVRNAPLLRARRACA